MCPPAAWGTALPTPLLAFASRFLATCRAPHAHVAPLRPLCCAGTASIKNDSVSSVTRESLGAGDAGSSAKGKWRAAVTSAVSRRRPAGGLAGSLAGSVFRQWRTPTWLLDQVMLAKEVVHAIAMVYIPRNPTSLLLWSAAVSLLPFPFARARGLPFHLSSSPTLASPLSSLPPFVSAGSI